MDAQTTLTVGLAALGIAILIMGFGCAWWLSKFGAGIETKIVAQMTLLRADLLGLINTQGSELRRLERELHDFKLESTRTFYTKGEQMQGEIRILQAIADLKDGRMPREPT